MQLTDKCCDQCWHSTDRPCSRFVECLTEGPLCHESPACRELREKALLQQRREKLDRPLIFIGMSTCGLGAGAGKTLTAIKTWLQGRKIAADIVETGCIGLCTGEPLVDIQLPFRTRLSFANITEDKVPLLLNEVFGGHPPKEKVLGQFRDKGQEAYADLPYLDEHPFFKPQTRWVLKNCGILDPLSIEDYLSHGGYQALSATLRSHRPAETCDIVEKSGLRGRGGGGFPAGKKWKLALQTPSDCKYLICNADEGDPGAFMDRAVIEGDPHRLIEGMAIAAYAIGATKAYVYLRAEYPLAIERLKHALERAAAFGLIGHNILDSGFNLDIVIKQGAGAFVCGEETALINSIEGRRGMPRLRPPYPAAKGLFDHPTIINNVETLSNVPAILQNGADWFASVGTAGSKGTKVFALSGKVNRTGLIEVAMGRSLREIIFTIGGGIPNNKAFKAIQIGGPSGGCIPDSHLDIQVDYESLKTVGAMMGSGGLVVMDESNCMVDVAKYFMEFIQRESCGKCIPCREGTRRMLEILRSLTRSRKNESRAEALDRIKGILSLERLADVIRDTALCGLGQSASNPVLSTLRWFKHEYEAHLYDRECPAKTCQDLITYRIDKKACKGCGLCRKKCPAEAILGEPRNAHTVITEKCIGCGTCLDVCKFNAVSVV
ncbi:MAG: NADH dehydrogenase [Elusimicrobia bacterium RIFOXYB2_FULL_49_7]|nr:MAG: NADH dehydrogenase [Elusimicrobia bacterium RIFOXYB2_FULL_49_7]